METTGLIIFPGDTHWRSEDAAEDFCDKTGASYNKEIEAALAAAKIGIYPFEFNTLGNWNPKSIRIVGYRLKSGGVVEGRLPEKDGFGNVIDHFPISRFIDYLERALKKQSRK